MNLIERQKQIKIKILLMTELGQELAWSDLTDLMESTIGRSVDVDDMDDLEAAYLEFLKVRRAGVS